MFNWLWFISSSPLNLGSFFSTGMTASIQMAAGMSTVQQIMVLILALHGCSNRATVTVDEFCSWLVPWLLVPLLWNVSFFVETTYHLFSTGMHNHLMRGSMNGKTTGLHCFSVNTCTMTHDYRLYSIPVEICSDYTLRYTQNQHSSIVHWYQCCCQSWRDKDRHLVVMILHSLYPKTCLVCT